MPRVYLPLTASRLRAAAHDGSFGPAPLAAHAVTPALCAELGVADEEELEYAAMTAASWAALALLGPDDPPVRLVAAVDVRTWEPADANEPSAVRVEHEVPVRRLAALLADSPDAAEEVVRAREAVRAGRPSEELLDRLADHELGWWAAQELDQLLVELGTWD